MELLDQVSLSQNPNCFLWELSELSVLLILIVVFRLNERRWNLCIVAG